MSVGVAAPISGPWPLRIERGPAPRAFGDFVWLLIKLPSTMDKRSDRLAVWLSGGPISGSASDPAPDAIGVIR